MDEFTMTGEAYKKGHREGFYAGRMEFGYSSAWGSGKNGERPCLACGNKGVATKFCPECGAAMVNPRPLSKD